MRIPVENYHEIAKMANEFGHTITASWVGGTVLGDQAVLPARLARSIPFLSAPSLLTHERVLTGRMRT